MNEKPLSRRARTITFWIFVTIFVIGAPLLILWSTGYRPVTLLSWEKSGAIYVYASQEGASIYLNEDEVHTTGFFQRGVFLSDITPGEHTVVVAKEGYWPWQKHVNVTNGIVEEAISFMIPRAPEGTVIFPRTDEQLATTDRPPNNLEYINIMEEFASVATSTFASIATSTEPLSSVVATSSRERVLLVAQKGGLIAEFNEQGADDPPRVFCDITPCRSEIIVFEGDTSVRQADFYPGRENVAILATGNGVYALDIDPRPPQNFQPIYKGTRPAFLLDGETIYIKDGELLFRIQL